MTENEKRMVLQLWENNTPIERIIKMLPYSTTVARKYVNELRQSGYLNKDNRINWENKIINAYQNGMTNPYDIAEEYGYTPETVRALLSRKRLIHGRPEHNYKKRQPADIDVLSEKTQQIIEDIKNGKTTTEIRFSRNVSRQYIWQIRKKYMN